MTLRPTKTTLFSSLRCTASIATIVTALGVTAVASLAQRVEAQQYGGTGGFRGAAGGVTDNTTGIGTDGGDAGRIVNVGSGGGGGAGGVVGGDGGSGGDSAFGDPATVGGAGGSLAVNGVGGAGADGQSSPGRPNGSGGGGGGAHGGVVSTLSGDYTGGDGGNGGSSRGGGGGGGGAGYGVILTGDGTNADTITGGNGGTGGNSEYGAGNGGDGGIGVLIIGDSVFVNTGIIVGGNGGQRGTYSNSYFSPSAEDLGVNGRGAVGILSNDNLDITLENGSSVTGGLSGDGVTRANAITMNGATNILRLKEGSSFLGNIVANGSDDTLELSLNTFDMGTLGGTGTLRGFEQLDLVAAPIDLSGTSSFTGRINILGNVQIMSAGALNGTSRVAIEMGGTLFLQAFDVDLGSLSGSGTIQSQGGILTVGASNEDTTFSGTLINSGEVNFVKTGTGSLTLAGETPFLGTTTVTNGRLILTALNTSRRIEISGGTLENRNASISAAAPFVLNVSGGTFENIDDQAINDLRMSSGVIDGTGALTVAAYTQSGGDLRGVVTTSGSPTLTGGTVSGRLSYGGTIEALGDIGVTGELDGDGISVAEGVTVSVTGNGTIGGAVHSINGQAGSVGTLTTDGDALDIGSTIDNSGVFETTGREQISAITGDGTVRLGTGADLILSDLDDTTFAGTLEGSGDFTKTGAGQMSFTGDGGSFVGTFAVTGGEFKINGTLGGTLDFAGGTLSGSGQLGDLNMNAGVLAPGNSIGTLNASGDVFIAAGTRYDVEIAANGTSDRIASLGNVTIAGGEVIPIATGDEAAYAPVLTYQIVTAAGAVSGTFDSVRNDAALATYSLSYGSQDVVLTRTVKVPPVTIPPVVTPPVVTPPVVTPPVVTPPVVTPPVVVPPVTPTPVVLPDFVGVSDTRNAGQVAGALGRFDFGSDPELMNTLLTLSRADINTAYNAMGGEVHTEAGFAAAAASGGFDAELMHIARHQADLFVGGQSIGVQASRDAVTASVPSDVAFSLRAYGSRSDVESDGNASGFETSGRGILAAVQKDFGALGVAGLALGYGTAQVALDTVAQSADVANLSVGIYGTRGAAIDETGLGLRGSLTYTRHDVDSIRDITVGGITREATASYVGRTVAGELELSYNTEMPADLPGRTMLSPFATLRVAKTTFDAFSETGAGTLNLSGQVQGMTATTVSLGVSAHGTYAMANGIVATPTVTVSYDRHLGDTYGMANLSLARSPDSFQSTGAQRDDDSLHLGVGSGFRFSDTSNISVSVDAIRSGNVTAARFGAAVQFTF